MGKNKESSDYSLSHDLSSLLMVFKLGLSRVKDMGSLLFLFFKTPKSAPTPVPSVEIGWRSTPPR